MRAHNKESRIFSSIWVMRAARVRQKLAWRNAHYIHILVFILIVALRCLRELTRKMLSRWIIFNFKLREFLDSKYPKYCPDARECAGPVFPPPPTPPHDREEETQGGAEETQAQRARARRDNPGSDARARSAPPRSFAGEHEQI